MGLTLIFECLVLLKWLEGEGLGPVGLTGVSMGGHVSRNKGLSRNNGHSRNVVLHIIWESCVNFIKMTGPLGKYVC